MTSSGYIIRKPQNKGEWDIVKGLLIDYKNEFDDDTCFTSFEAELMDIENLYAQEGNLKLVTVSEQNGEIVGCVAFRTHSPGVAEMKRLYVVPKCRGLQLGRRMAEAIIVEATTRGYKSMILDTMMEMKAAQQLYHDLGFVIIPPYNHQDTSKVICFEKNLKAN